MIVLNHGTLNHMDEDQNIITVLARALGYPGNAGGSDQMFFGFHDGVFVTNGVGSTLLDIDLLRLGQQQGGIGRSRNSALTNTLHAGVKDGGEVKNNVGDYRNALDQYFDFHGSVPEKVDFVGYSRGAVTCFKMMNQESEQRKKKGWESWKPSYRVFALDPVPGITTEDNKHMWDDVEITNVNAIDKRIKCFILLSEGERRVTFTPMLPRQARVKGNKEVCDYDTMPGVHIAMAGSEGHHKTPMFQLIKDMIACNFGDDYPFTGLRCPSDWHRFNLYAKVLNGLEKNLTHGRGLAEMALFKETELNQGRRFHVPGQGPTPRPTGSMGTGGATRTIHDYASQDPLRSNKLDKRSSSTARGKVRVFVNTAHKKLCQKLLVTEFDGFRQCDKGVWENKSRNDLIRASGKPNIAGLQELSIWVDRLIDKGPWKT